MVGLKDRIGVAVSSAELERRWRLTREAMNAAQIDALLVQSNNDYLGGYVRWFCDIPATTGYPITLVFTEPGDMRFVSQGRFGLDEQPPIGGAHRGVSRILGAPGYASARYTARYEAEAAAAALQDLPRATVGLVGAGHTAVLLDHLRAEYKHARFVDASDLVDRLKAEKSDEELALIRRAAAMQDACMAALREQIRPGMRDLQFGAVAERVGRDHGSEQGIFLVASAPQGEPAVYGIRRYQSRVAEKGDYVSVLVENSGPGGYYTEMGRTFVLGRAGAALKDAFAFTVAAQAFAMGRLAAGDAPGDVWRAFNAHLRENGFPEESRLFCHGQGYDLVERPLVRFDEPMHPCDRLNIACHPTIVTRRIFTSCCDNFWLREGRSERLHQFPQAIIEIE